MKICTCGVEVSHTVALFFCLAARLFPRIENCPGFLIKPIRLCQHFLAGKRTRVSSLIFPVIVLMFDDFRFRILACHHFL